MPREFNVDVFVHPTKYLLWLPITKIVADKKVQRLIIEHYKRKIRKGDDIRPIVVIEKPNREIYAVWDGHHRYYAYLELGIKAVRCAYAGNLSGLLFFMVEHGFFQPTSEVVIDPFLTVVINREYYLRKILKPPNLCFQKLRNHVLKFFATPMKWSTPEQVSQPKDGQFKVLFVCTANSFRSPICEALLKKLRPEFMVDSAGTNLWRNGVRDSVSNEAKRFLTAEGAIQYLKKTPEGIYEKRLEEYDNIIALEQVHKKILTEKCPECKNRIIVWDIHDKIPFFYERTENINKQLKKKVIEYSNSLAKLEVELEVSTAYMATQNYPLPSISLKKERYQTSITKTAIPGAR